MSRRFQANNIAPLCWSVIDIKEGTVVAMLDDHGADKPRMDAEIGIQARVMADGLNELYELAQRLTPTTHNTGDER